MKSAIIFAMGAVCGSIGTWLAVKGIYEKRMQDEIESVKEVYSKYFDRKETEEMPSESDDGDPVKEIDDMNDIIMENKYISSATSDKEPDVVNDVPYVIKPEEYGEFAEYSQISLTYYSNGIIVDEMDEIVDDVDELLGPNVESHFGEYEEDSVHIRNDRTKCDYEILYDLRPYEG